ncbi:MAG TPA: type II secretion system F family protein [Vicinamibacterales bacterium]|nr:type II secretion system F family protein [Vicinamibacterales bacterium]
MLLPVLAFLFGSLLIAAAAMAFMPAATATIERRLGEVTGTRVKPSGDDPGYDRVMVDTLKRFGAMVPQSRSEMGKLQQRLVTAGYRRHDAIAVFFGIRLACALGIFALLATPILMKPNLLLALLGCALGYLLPSMALGRLAKKRQHRIRLGLPDALDLLVVSVEAGLGLDQAMQRVGTELDFAHPELSEELRLINLELRAGKARVDALRNLAERTGVDDIISLVAMLVQTDKFGTSVAQSLRVHSDTVRTKRRQRAEEAAAKTGVKMVFPLVFCIFPAIWIVTIGPAVIKFIEVIVPMNK